MTCRIATVCLWMCIHIVLSFIYGMEHMPSQKALLLLSHVEHGTYLTMQMQCCTRKPFWVAKPEPQSCSSSAFPHFEADAEIGVYDLSKWSILRLTLIHPADIGRASHLYFAALNIWCGEPWQCLGRLPTIVGREQSPAAVLIVWRPIQYRFALNCIALRCVLHFPQRSMHNLLICFFEHRTATFLPCFVLCHTCLLLTILIVCLDWVSHRFMFIF